MSLRNAMNSVLAIVVALILAVVVLFIGLAVKSRSGAALGLVNGKLAQCPDKPNCVCSEYKDDKAHYIAPITVEGAKDIMPVITSTMMSMGGEVVRQTNDYLAATFSSRVFGFVDDVEIRLNRTAGQIQIRSASRVGHSDLGVNRKRAEQISQLLEKNLKDAK